MTMGAFPIAVGRLVSKKAYLFEVFSNQCDPKPAAGMNMLSLFCPSLDMLSPSTSERKVTELPFWTAMFSFALNYSVDSPLC